MKKLLSITVTLCLLITCFSAGAFADSETSTPKEIGPMPGNESAFSTSILQEIDIEDLTYDILIEEIELYYENNFTPTAADYEKANRIIEVYNENFDSNTVPLRSDYDENKAKLRAGNLIELTLDMDEGVSEFTAVAAIALASSAKSTAQEDFPDTWDSAQHFIWNYKMADTYNAYTARTIGINHEWGLILINPMISHYDSEYADRIASGESEAEASAGALADTILYIPEFKYLTTVLTQSSYESFKILFTADNIMDLWNNCYGRAYAGENYSSASAAYTAAKNAGELIIDGSDTMAENVTENHFYYVWDWDWYTY